MTRERHWYANLLASGRLAIAAAMAVVAVIAMPSGWSTGLQFLVAWDILAGVYLALAWLLIAHADATATRRHARTQDVGAFVIFISVLTAAFACIGAIAVLLESVKHLAPVAKTVHVALSLVALVLSWLLIHTIYSFHYARRYYEARDDRREDSRGLHFPGRENPDYFDFAYYSFVVGMTSQVSDVAVNAHHMRRLTLVHGVLSFMFNIAILALSINIIVTVI